MKHNYSFDTRRENISRWSFLFHIDDYLVDYFLIAY